MIKWRELAQKIQMMLAPCNDVVNVVTSSDGGASQKQQHFSQRIHNPPWLPAIRKLRELLEENCHPRPRHLVGKDCIHVRAPSRISAPWNHVHAVKTNFPPLP